MTHLLSWHFLKHVRYFIAEAFCFFLYGWYLTASMCFFEQDLIHKYCLYLENIHYSLLLIYRVRDNHFSHQLHKYHWKHFIKKKSWLPFKWCSVLYFTKIFCITVLQRKEMLVHSWTSIYDKCVLHIHMQLIDKTVQQKKWDKMSKTSNIKKHMDVTE